MLRKICAAIALLSVLWILGVLGAGDLDTMSFTQICIHLGIALPVCISSLYVGGFIL